jgi:hypothetical protein
MGGLGLGAYCEKISPEVECIPAEISLAIGDAVASASTAVSTEREKGASRTSGHRRDGWSAQYGAVIADVRSQQQQQQQRRQQQQ